ncbi:MAG: lytic transglycosylase domain-containing protein [Clostridiaceae bacterium]|nr:lytic transglycosylase domain-containing protein [Clostridiaceae bacterium]
MNIQNVNDILNQKIASVRARLNEKLSILSQINSGSTEFDNALSEATEKVESEAPVIDPELVEGRKPRAYKTSKTKYPLVSGSYESVYPRLSQAQIQELMPRIEAAINKYSQQYGVDPKLVRAVMKQESGFQPFALSTSGAMGLMQLMPGTAAGLGVTDPYNIEENIRGGVQYLSYQLKAFNNVELALAAYNAGPNAVRKYGGIPPYAQTQDYVKKVMNYFEIYQSMGDNQ